MELATLPPFPITRPISSFETLNSIRTRDPPPLCPHLHIIGMIHQRFGDVLNQVFHNHFHVVMSDVVSATHNNKLN